MSLLKYFNCLVFLYCILLPFLMANEDFQLLFLADEDGAKRLNRSALAHNM